MALFTFDQPGAETKTGTDGENDLFVSSNNFFGAGDRAFGMGGIDEFLYFADPSLTVDAVAKAVPAGFFAGPTKTFAAFQLNSVEVATVTNDSGATLIWDMSSSAGTTNLVSANSSSAVIWDQVTNLAQVRLNTLTFAATSDIAVGYQDAVLAGATTVDLVFQNTNGDQIRLGGASGGSDVNAGATLGLVGNNGIETVRVTAIGSSTVNTINTNLTSLIIDAASTGNIVINNSLNSTVTTVANNGTGNATVSAAAAAQAVTFTGVGGSESFTGGAFNDTFNLGNGNNTAFTGGGNNTVNTGNGEDIVWAQGVNDVVNTGGNTEVSPGVFLGDAVVDQTTGFLTANLGDGSDSLIAIGGNFNASAGAGFDNIQMGAGYDALFIDALTGGVADDLRFAQITGLEAVAINTAGSTYLGGGVGGLAQQAGVNAIFISSGIAGNDTVNAGTFTTGLTVISTGTAAAGTAAALSTQAGRIARFGGIDSTGGGDDSVTTGSAVDYFLFRGDGALTSADNLVAGGQTNAGGTVVGDTLVLEGDTTLAGGGFSGFEFVALESAVGSAYRTQAPSNAFGNQYSLTLTNANAPSTGPLYINGSNLKGAVAGMNADEFVVVNAGAVTAYGLDITTGGGADTIILGGAGALAARVTTQGGNDTISESAGNTADDVIDAGLGNNVVSLVGGNNTVFAGEFGNATSHNIINMGAGDDSIYTGGGSDFINGTGGNLTGADTLADAGGFDAIFVDSGTPDAAFAGVNAGGAANSRYEVLFLSNAGATTLGANAARAGFTMIIGSGLDQTINLNNASFAKGMTVDLSAGGNDVVNLGNVSAIAAPSATAATPAGLFDFIEGSPGYNWPLGGFPNNIIDYSANANLVIAGVGNQTVNGGTGSDVVRVTGTVWNAADIFNGGNGYDAMQFDNNSSTANGPAALTATVNLTNVSNVELFQVLGSGLRTTTPANLDVDTNTINFTGGNVGTLTTLKLDNSALTDTKDSTTFVLQAGLIDSDYAFNIIGGAGATIVDKQNLGVNNNISFYGGSGMDWLLINGGDLGSTTVFNGGAGMDRIVQTGGQITDDDYFQVTNVEILTGTPGSPINAVLGATAAGSGMTTIIGTAGNDVVVLDPAFFANLAVQLNGGNDTFSGGGAAGTMTFSETLLNITSLDVISGGANGADVFNISAAGGGSANLTNVSQVEIYNVTANGGNAIDLVLGAGAVNGAQTFNILGTAGATNIGTTIHGAAATANTVVNLLSGPNAVTLGSGNDIVNGGSLGDSIYGGAGNDTLRGFGGNDELSGGNGNDTLDGGSGNDKLRGQAGNDTILGGAGDDVIYGGAGADFLDGGAGADVYLYDGTTTGDSQFGARDTVVVGLGDTFDFGFAVTFVGNQANFADAQSAVSLGGAVEAVFQADTNILWLDVNNDGTLNNNDLQIQIQFADGLTGFTNAFFANTTTVAAFDASFTPAV